MSPHKPSKRDRELERTAQSTAIPRRVAVVYNFYPHYRTPVFEALVRDPRCEWTFFGDTVDVEKTGIKLAPMEPPIRFRRIRNRLIRGGVLWQHGAMGVALSREFDTLILMGAPKHLAMWPTAILGRCTGKRVLFWTHGWTARPRGWNGRLRRWFYGLAHGILTYGRWAKELGVGEGFARDSIHVIGNSLDFEAQTAIYRTLDASTRDTTRMEIFGDASRPVVVWVGRLIASKRLDLLFDAMKVLAERGRRPDIVLIGDGPEREFLRAKADELAAHHGIRTHFEGACYDERRLGQLLHAANVLVAPGNVGLSAMHAMAFGTPVVSHGDPERQGPEFESIVDGQTGSLFAFGSVEGLAAAIDRWIAAPFTSLETELACRAEVEARWSPAYQVEALVRAVLGETPLDSPA
jgi:1,2-diacylglycerol 3-alpha-glucosyltransferase